MLLPLVAVIVGTSALGSELEDGTIVYLLARPVPRWRIAIVKWLMAWLVTSLLVAPAIFIAGLIGHGDGQMALGYAVAVGGRRARVLRGLRRAIDHDLARTHRRPGVRRRLGGIRGRALRRHAADQHPPARAGRGGGPRRQRDSRDRRAGARERPHHRRRRDGRSPRSSRSGGSATSSCAARRPDGPSTAMGPRVGRAASTSTSFDSEALTGNPLGDPHRRPVYVYTPPGYDAEPERRYPTVYLIQGLTGPARHVAQSQLRRTDRRRGGRRLVRPR